MPSSESYRRFVPDQLAALPDVGCRAMMGEYILYYRNRIFGGIYDDRLLVKPVTAALARLPDAPCEVPYPGAREMLLVEAVDDAAFLCELVAAMADELPAPKPKK